MPPRDASPGEWRQCVERREHGLGRSDQLAHEWIVDEQPAVILACITHLVRLGEQAPDFATETESVGERLEDDVPAVGAVALSAQGREAEGMRRVVGEIESAGEREPRHLGIRGALATGSDQPRVLCRIWLLPVQRSARSSEVLKWGRHPRLRTARSCALLVRCARSHGRRARAARARRACRWWGSRPGQAVPPRA